MGQIATRPSVDSILLTAVDRLIAANADGGLSPLASHIVLLGEHAGRDMGDVDYVYVIGADSVSGGLNDAAQEGLTVYGAKNASALTNVSPGFRDGPLVIVGYNNIPTMRGHIGENQMIGSGMFANYNPANGLASVDANVLVGTGVMANNLASDSGYGFNCRLNVIMGYNAARCDPGIPGIGTGGVQFGTSVVIGANAMINTGTGPTGTGAVVTGAVVMGYQACPVAGNTSGGSFQNSVFIGAGVAPQLRTAEATVVIGPGTLTPVNGLNFSTFIGANIRGNTHELAIANVALGCAANLQELNENNILIGTGANGGGDLGNNTANNVLIETTRLSTGQKRTTLFAKWNTPDVFNPPTSGGIVLGNSDITNRDLPGLNIVKLIEGSWDGTPPVGGGLFYADSLGDVHWVNEAGQDFALTPSASLGNFTVATLPAAPSQGSRANVTDALAPAFGAAVVGGGAVFVPVFFDGATWNVG